MNWQVKVDVSEKTVILRYSSEKEVIIYKHLNVYLTFWLQYRPFPHYTPGSKHKRNKDEARVDNFIQITVFCQPEPRVGAFVNRNAGKVYLKSCSWTKYQQR